MIPVLLLVAYAVWAIKDIRKSERETEAIELWSLFCQKIHELINDPFTFDSDWKELIPVLESVDDEVARNMVNVKMCSLAEIARRQQYDDPEDIVV